MIHHSGGPLVLGVDEIFLGVDEVPGFAAPEFGEENLLFETTRREGDATRGGALGAPGLTPVTDRSSAHAALDAAAAGELNDSQATQARIMR